MNSLKRIVNSNSRVFNATRRTKQWIRFYSTPVEFGRLMDSQNTKRLSIVGVDGSYKLSNERLLSPLLKSVEEETRRLALPNGQLFEGVFVEKGEYGLYAAFVHNTSRGAGCGGARVWNYDSFDELFRDGLRLSVGMTRKSALAGLWVGGGKSIVCVDDPKSLQNPETRHKIFQEHGRFVSSLRGCYQLAEDIGATVQDMVSAHSTTRFVTCIPREMGGSGNPSEATAHGVVAGMKAALKHKGRTLKGAKIASHGCGTVATFLFEALLKEGAEIVEATDVNPDAVARTQQRFGINARLVPRGDVSVLSSECDVLSLNALGGVLNHETIASVKAGIVCGAANNQLQDASRDSLELHKRGILYCPDFVVNRAGIVNCAHEDSGNFGNSMKDPEIQKHFSTSFGRGVYAVTLTVIDESIKHNTSTDEVAKRLADDASTVLHPLWPQRQRNIIRSLVADNWHEQI